MSEEKSPETLEDKKAILKKLQEECNKKYGENSLVTMNSSSFQSVPKRSCGINGIDALLGGGWGKEEL